MGGMGAIAMADRSYDPELDITARELRRMGVPLEEEVPDCAWVPRAALDWSFDAERGGMSAGQLAAGRLTVTVKGRVVFREPLRWVEIRGEFV